MNAWLEQYRRENSLPPADYVPDVHALERAPWTLFVQPVRPAAARAGPRRASRDRRATYTARPTREEGFAMTGNPIIYDHKVSDAAVRVYLVLAGHAWRAQGEGEIAGVVPDLAVGQLAADLHKGESTIRRLLNELVDSGHVHRQRTPAGTYSYTLPWLVFHFDAKAEKR